MPDTRATSTIRSIHRRASACVALVEDGVAEHPLRETTRRHAEPLLVAMACSAELDGPVELTPDEAP